MVEATENLQKKYNRKDCENLLNRKFFYVPSFEIYGGVSGLYDYGPLGSMLKNNVEQLWRQHFVLEEDMLEVTCSNITPEEVLKTSGHVEKFADFMVRDTKTHQCHRADKLIEEFVEKALTKKNLKPEEKEKLAKVGNDAGAMGQDELNKVIAEFKIKAPDTNNDLSEALPFNLMFETQIGPSGYMKGFMRPETAQGIFVNFRRLLDYNNCKMPFAAAQIGTGFRNEIHPKQGLLRVREFTMAEIEHFVDGNNKDHPKFTGHIAELILPLFTKHNQESSRVVIRDLPVGKAVELGVIDNQTLAYFMARSYQFLLSVGIPDAAIRFRQHRDNEMAHYAKDCWDAEIETSYGWIEIAGHADRSCFDLTRHAQRTKTELKAPRQLKEPKLVKTIKITQNKQTIGKTFKADAKIINEHLEELEEEPKEKLMKEMEANGQIVIKTASGKEFTLSKEVVTFEAQEKMTQEEKYTPSVIEPSFGIGRIIYCIFEHCFRIRPDNILRTYFQFPALIAPLKTSILPLMDNAEMNTKVREIKAILTRSGVTSKVDGTGTSIGRRYARTDECGIPFAITVDFDTLQDNTVTLRDLITMKQVRLSIDEVAGTIVNLANNNINWEEVTKKYPAFVAKDSDKDDKD